MPKKMYGFKMCKKRKAAFHTWDFLCLSSSHTNTPYVIQQKLKDIDSDKAKEMSGEL